MVAELQQVALPKGPAVESARSRLKNIHILLADEDPCLSHVIIHNLRAMGFSRITYARSAAEVERALRASTVHVLITERHLQGLDGIELVKSIRSGERGDQRNLPIIMLTGHGEILDVTEARDAGISEFIIKPFSAKILYSRIEQIVDKPRSFLVSRTYTGPDRRRKGMPPAGEADRRTLQPRAKQRLDIPVDPDEMPIVISPDFTIKRLMGTAEPLSRIITPALVEEAQKTIDALSDSYMHWLTVDLKILEQSHHAMTTEYATYHMIKAKNAALSIKGRAGVFGFALASDVARLLFLFMHNDFTPPNARHSNIISQHIDALKVILARKIREGDPTANELLRELQRLVISQK